MWPSLDRPGSREGWCSDYIAAGNCCPHTSRRYIRGADREKIEGDAELIPTRGVTLYAVNTDAEFVTPDKKLQVFNTSDPMNKRGPAELILYVRNKT